MSKQADRAGRLSHPALGPHNGPSAQHDLPAVGAEGESRGSSPEKGSCGAAVRAPRQARRMFRGARPALRPPQPPASGTTDRGPAPRSHRPRAGAARSVDAGRPAGSSPAQCSRPRAPSLGTSRTRARGQRSARRGRRYIRAGPRPRPPRPRYL